MTGHVRKKGDTWYYSFELDKVNGKRKRIERIGGSTKKDAEKALRVALKEFEDNGKITKTTSLTVEQYFEYWYQNYVVVECKYNTCVYYKNLIIRHINPKFGLRKLNSITSEDIRNFLVEKFKSGLSKSSLETLKSTLSGAFNYAISPCKFLKENPVKDAKLPKYSYIPSVTEEEIISKEDFEKIIERFNKNTSFYIPLMIGYYTGARISEVFGLTWDNINFEEKTLTINKQIQKRGRNWYFETTKTNGSNRTIAIGDTLLKILENHKHSQKLNKEKYSTYYSKNYEVIEKSDNTSNRRIIRNDFSTEITLGKELFFLCTKENGDIITPESFKYVSKIIHFELQINFNFKFFRHTHATVLLENGATHKGLQNRLGHDRIETTLNTYAHVTRKLDVDTADIFEKKG